MRYLRRGCYALGWAFLVFAAVHLVLVLGVLTIYVVTSSIALLLGGMDTSAFSAPMGAYDRARLLASFILIVGAGLLGAFLVAVGDWE